MDKNKTFVKNLETIRKSRGMTNSEFSKQLGLPKSTFQSVMKDWQTTLHTALRISEKLNVPIDSLTDEDFSGREYLFLERFMEGFSWFVSLSEEGRRSVANCVRTALEVLQNE